MSTPAVTSSAPLAPVSTIKTSLATPALIVGLIGLAVATIGLIGGISTGDGRAAMSWLIGFSFWFSAAIGVLFLVMIFYIFDAGWPVVIRRTMEHMLAVFPWLGLIFLPLLLIGLGLFGQDASGILWKWMNLNKEIVGGGTVAEDVLYLNKAPYLNLPFFTVRVIGYFALFCGLAWLLRRSSFGMDTDPNPARVHTARKVSAIGIILAAMATSFAAFDFYMSISYHWFSTMYGVWFFSASMRAGLAIVVIACFILAAKGPLKGLYNRAHRYNLGCLCFAFTVFWAYISFSQYFLIYNANIPEETFWYNIRELNANWSPNSWWFVSLFGLVLCYFLVPFFYLLFYNNKVTSGRLLFICCWILFFHLIDLYFNILPTQKPYDGNVVGYKVQEFIPTIFDLASLVGIGGICVWAFLRSLKKTEIIPIHDPRIEESINYHE